MGKWKTAGELDWEWNGKGRAKLGRIANDRGGWKRTVNDWVHPRPSGLRSK